MSDYQGNSGQRNDVVYWLLALGLIFAGFTAPIGVLMIALKVFGGRGKKHRQQGRHPYYEQQSPERTGARTTWTPPIQETPSWEAASQAAPSWEEPVRRKSAPKSKKKRNFPTDLISEMDKKGKSWMVAGGATAAGCFLGFLGSLSDTLYWLFEGEFSLFVEELAGPMVLLCCVAGGLGGLWAGLRKRRQASRYRNYLAMIGRQSSISISALASATGRSPGRVRDDLADMLDEGLLPQGYLDYGGDRLVLSADGLSQQPKPEQPAPPPPKEDENAVLAEIKAVNDAIDNEKLSAQIERIRVITSKILDYQKSHPEKAAQLHSFLSYYLPTTLKILRAYGQLEDQEVAGANITAAMHRIEGMMDKVVEGFEKQLDLLFQGDAMDITTDVEVLERMLAKDGLSDQEGLTLGL